MEIEYCDRWSSITKEPFNDFDIEKARQNHIKGKVYTAIIKEDGDITNTIEITGKYINVRFFNEHCTPYLSYVFDVKDNANVFLSSIVYHSYDEEGNKKLESLIFSFHENGYIVMELNDFIKNECVEKDLNADVSTNWEKFPEFGEYEHLLVKERPFNI